MQRTKELEWMKKKNELPGEQSKRRKKNEKKNKPNHKTFCLNHFNRKTWTSAFAMIPFNTFSIIHSTHSQKSFYCNKEIMNDARIWIKFLINQKLNLLFKMFWMHDAWYEWRHLLECWLSWMIKHAFKIFFHSFLCHIFGSTIDKAMNQYYIKGMLFWIHPLVHSILYLSSR